MTINLYPTLLQPLYPFNTLYPSAFLPHHKIVLPYIPGAGYRSHQSELNYPT